MTTGEKYITSHSSLQYTLARVDDAHTERNCIFGVFFVSNAVATQCLPTRKLQIQKMLILAETLTPQIAVLCVACEVPRIFSLAVFLVGAAVDKLGTSRVFLS